MHLTANRVRFMKVHIDLLGMTGVRAIDVEEVAQMGMDYINFVTHMLPIKRGITY